MTEQQAMRMALEAMEYADACLKKQLTTKTKHEYAQDLLLEAGTALRQALEQQPAMCQHEWVSAKNKVVQNGSICVRCLSLDIREPHEIEQQPADELLRLRDLLGKANALARIRANEIESLKAKLKEKNT